MTVTAWVKTSQTTGTAGLVNKYLSGSFNGWQLYMIDGNVRAWYFGDASDNIWDGVYGLNGGRIADGTWHHVAFAVNVNGGSLYVDGNLKASLPWSGRPLRSSSIQPLQFGTYPGVEPNYFRGIIDEVTVWSVRLSQAEIADRMHRSMQGDENGLVAYYRFDESDGPIVFDSCPRDGQNGGLVGANPVRIASTAPIPSPAPTNGLPVIVKSPLSQEVEAGSPVLFSVKDVGEPRSYQWELNGLAIENATNSSYTLSGAAPSDAGAYTVESQANQQSKTSLPVPLRVLTVPECLSQ
ncbi:MAG TPA: LamG-like jellyroll fold domain-containing protein, partial [Candidatus Limnocylindria bacterium]|nr:LamG-like jellyroll fold domain-containing protein [Candidatus Limnocylindria bacterium]